ncbi:alpha-2,8-sialyltransferase 8F [Menidia menidia]|uniref:(Atlantic silverside) hypothetical protein n=1 Tax=Menidia menidia TaxID=238744 RepID=A0A8S4ASU2_9TELE|nr:unnamed protein product [Menidia menidia]
MRGQLLKQFLSLMITLLFLGSLLTTLFWYMLDNTSKEHKIKIPQKKGPPEPSNPCKDCGEIINKAIEIYSHDWKKQEDNYQNFRSQLRTRCRGFEKAILTQANTQVGSKLVYDGEKKRSIKITPEIFSTFPKELPFSNKTLNTCAVVGNGGILVNSSCGETIDSNQFIIRCNLPPLSNAYQKHVGIKTELVTANPSILFEKYGALMGRRRPFVESLHTYGANTLLLLPAFSYGHNTPVSLRTYYTIEDFGISTRTIFFNPEYLQSLALFWRSQGLRAVRLSTGIIMASLALELCSNVDLYGFWPFSVHPHGFHALTNHYYDNRQTKTKFHAMPAEFDLLLKLHSQGVLRLHLGDCK